jgi:hypothetical protein
MSQRKKERIAMPKTSFADIVTDWEHLLVKIAANAFDLSFLEEPRGQLALVLQGAKDASARQSTFKAQLQQATRDLEANLNTGRDLATRLRNGVRTRYGLADEKLTDFQLRPRRKLQRNKQKGKKKTASPESVAPVASADSPIE